MKIRTLVMAGGCTALRYSDNQGRGYLGRTMELTGDLPYQMVYFPKGHTFTSNPSDGASPLQYTSKFALMGIAMPDVSPSAAARATPDDFKVLDGMNEAGLSFSILAYPTAEGPQKQVEMTRAVLDAIDLGSWALGQFARIDQVKQALEHQPVVLEPVEGLSGAKPPFHFVLYDTHGASIVIEFEKGERTVYDNPLGVMTNGPQFSWHLTNLNNYSHLSNLDASGGTLGAVELRQPDSGIATAGLPSSDTSVGRFVRAAYYAHFAEKVDDADEAVLILSHVMSNFDRPKGISVSPSGEGDALSSGLGLAGGLATEYTTWTKLADPQRGLFYVRSSEALNYTKFDLNELAELEGVRIAPLHKFSVFTDGTGELKNAGH